MEILLLPVALQKFLKTPHSANKELLWDVGLYRYEATRLCLYLNRLYGSVAETSTRAILMSRRRDFTQQLVCGRAAELASRRQRTMIVHTLWEYKFFYLHPTKINTPRRSINDSWLRRVKEIHFDLLAIFVVSIRRTELAVFTHWITDLIKFKIIVCNH